MKDYLFFKVFNNKVLFNHIFYYVKTYRDHEVKYIYYYPLDNIKLKVIFNSLKLFELKYQSYKYYKDLVGDIDTCHKMFIDIANDDGLRYFFESRVISFERFVELYHDLNYLILLNKSYSNDLIIESLVGSKSKMKIEYLLNIGDIYFYINNIKSIINRIFKMNGDNEIIEYEYLQYIINSFKNQMNDMDQDEFKQYFGLMIMESLYNSIIYKQEHLYELLFKQSIEYLDTHVNKKERPYVYGKDVIYSYRNTLIGLILIENDLLMAQIYVKYFKGQLLNQQDKIKFYCKKINIKSYSCLVINGILEPLHVPFKQLDFLQYTTVDEYIDLMQYYKNNKYLLNPKHSISYYSNIETIQYLVNERSTLFNPPLQFNTNTLIHHAAIKKDLQLILYLFKEFSLSYSQFKIKNTSFEIFKFFFEGNSEFIFNDIAFPIAYNGQLEYAKYIVELYKNNHPRVQLSYRSLERVLENGYLELAQYLLNEIGHLGISRDAINLAIKSGNIHIIELIKNVKVTKLDEQFTIYDQTYSFIKCNKRYDILNSLIDSIYKEYFIEFKINN